MVVLEQWTYADWSTTGGDGGVGTTSINIPEIQHHQVGRIPGPPGGNIILVAGGGGGGATTYTLELVDPGGGGGWWCWTYAGGGIGHGLG